jgi:uncharacterized protein YjbI with pentapeptide repeats
VGRIRVEELLNRYGAGERNFAETVLTGAEMTNVDLSGIDLSNSDLGEIYMEDVNFTRANLRTSRIGQSAAIRCIFRDADLTEASMGFSYLAGADFTRAKLINAYLSGADMVGINLTHANLTGADLDGACIEKAIFDNTTMPDGSSYTNQGLLQDSANWSFRSHYPVATP